MTVSKEEIYAFAEQAGAKWPALVVAQFTLESGHGLHVSGKNNFFGLKGSGTVKTTTEYYDGKEVKIEDSFIDFESPQACVNYLVERWYKDFKGYKGVNNARTAEEAAQMLVSEGYATDPWYAQKLLKIMAKTDDYVNLLNVPEYFTGAPHQVAALKTLQSSLTLDQKKAFTDMWRKAAPAAKFPLKVPYFYQRDSKTWQGERMCQSSSIAMRVEQIDPSIVGDDDSYLDIVNRFGDTTSQSAHQKALSSLGLKAQFLQNGTEAMLCQLLDKGMAVPIGILHKGSISKPSGGGHWVTLTGYDEAHFYVHDPFGELDLINGGYPKTGPTDGSNVRYTRKNLMKRWLIHSANDGWLWVVEK